MYNNSYMQAKQWYVYKLGVYSNNSFPHAHLVIYTVCIAIIICTDQQIFFNMHWSANFLNGIFPGEVPLVMNPLLHVCKLWHQQWCCRVTCTVLYTLCMILVLREFLLLYVCTYLYTCRLYRGNSIIQVQGRWRQTQYILFRE